MRIRLFAPVAIPDLPCIQYTGTFVYPLAVVQKYLVYSNQNWIPSKTINQLSNRQDKTCLDKTATKLTHTND